MSTDTRGSVDAALEGVMVSTTGPESMVGINHSARINSASVWMTAENKQLASDDEQRARLPHCKPRESQPLPVANSTGAADGDVLMRATDMQGIIANPRRIAIFVKLCRVVLPYQASSTV